MASTVFDNYPEIKAALSSLGASWDFTARGRRKSLGDDMLDLVAEMILYRTIGKQLQPDGAPLARLKPATLRRKARLGYPETVGIENHEMLHISELQGERQITRRVAVMDYGTAPATRLRAAVFQEGRPGVQAPRPFYELDPEIEEALDGVFEANLEQHIRDLGGD